MPKKPRDILIVTGQPLAEAQKTAKRFEDQGFQTVLYESLCPERRNQIVVLKCRAIGNGKVMIFCQAD